MEFSILPENSDGWKNGSEMWVKLKVRKVQVKVFFGDKSFEDKSRYSK